MTDKTYLLVENNVVTNVVVWDGLSDWIVPNGMIALDQDTTPTMVWTVPTATTASVLEPIMGIGAIGYTWNGSTLSTGQTQPVYVAPPLKAAGANQPQTTGTTTIA
jgi:hypothetical protein